MSDNLLLEILRPMRADMSEMRIEMREQRGRPGSIERSLAPVERDGAEHRIETGGNFDRIRDKLDLIGRRLDLRDGP